MHTDRIAKKTAAKKLHGKWLQEVWRLEDLLEEAKRRELDSFAAADVARKSDANRRNNLAQLASGRVEVIDILESDALESPLVAARRPPPRHPCADRRGRHSI